ncbi:hypothetical protein DPMN_173398 [Dreissena polymorpha]|uniref:Uncharacterized protein n=1 Tax=Dreissena polymorpha TaxID=45954 RepID=A0A9D4E2L9_DREPO|nr:hypothetical protein DPMN_173398 [Dreissena polymorpha]
MKSVAMLAVAAVVLACALQAEAHWGLGEAFHSRRIGRPSFGRLRPPPPITPIFYPVPYPVNPARENVGADALALITSFALRGTPQGLGFDLFDLFRRV